MQINQYVNQSINNPCSPFVHFMTKVTLSNNITPVESDSVINTALEDKGTYTGALPPRPPPNVPHTTPVKLTTKS